MKAGRRRVVFVKASAAAQAAPVVSMRMPTAPVMFMKSITSAPDPLDAVDWTASITHALALFPTSRISQSSSATALRPYVLRFIAHDGTRSVVAFADRDERDERGAQLLTFGSTVTLATVRGAA